MQIAVSPDVRDPVPTPGQGKVRIPGLNQASTRCHSVANSINSAKPRVGSFEAGGRERGEWCTFPYFFGGASLRLRLSTR